MSPSAPSEVTNLLRHADHGLPDGDGVDGFAGGGIEVVNDAVAGPDDELLLDVGDRGRNGPSGGVGPLAGPGLLIECVEGAVEAADVDASLPDHDGRALPVRGRGLPSRRPVSDVKGGYRTLAVADDQQSGGGIDCRGGPDFGPDVSDQMIEPVSTLMAVTVPLSEPT